MLFSPAYAQTGGGGGAFDVMFLVPLVLMFGIMYFLMIRPQQQRLKTHREMIANVKRGDEVVTGGGIIGKIHRVVDDNEVQVEIADGVRVRMRKSMISEVKAKGEPAKDAASS